VIKNKIFSNFADNLRSVSWGPVLHYHLTTWPDFGVANSTETVLELVQTVNSAVQQNGSNL
jgi:hypothetical protein